MSSQIQQDYQSELNAAESIKQSEVSALYELINSSSYQKGTLHEYTTVEIFQPSAKRRKYDDDGYRKLLLPQKHIKNMQKEDELYQQYYGIPN